MIPPSLVLIVYGVAINESIAKLFIAGIVPGLVLAALFMGYVMVWAILRKDRVPPGEPDVTLAEKLRQSRFLIPVVCLIVTVLGSIYLGFATATEAASFGVLGALLLAAVQRSLTWESFVESLMGAVRTSCMIALILAGSAFLALSMGFTGLPRALAAWIATLQLSPVELIAALTVFYIILGCFLDGISIVVLTMAVVEPMVRAAGIDLIWFGIFIVVVVEMAQITPPVGFNLFVLQGMTGHEISYIARTAVPFFLLMCLMVVLLVIFPGACDLAAGDDARAAGLARRTAWIRPFLPYMSDVYVRGSDDTNPGLPDQGPGARPEAPGREQRQEAERADPRGDRGLPGRTPAEGLEGGARGRVRHVGRPRRPRRTLCRSAAGLESAPETIVRRVTGHLLDTCVLID